MYLRQSFIVFRSLCDEKLIVIRRSCGVHIWLGQEKPSIIRIKYEKGLREKVQNITIISKSGIGYRK
jgi:hypothetical protein